MIGARSSAGQERGVPNLEAGCSNHPVRTNLDAAEDRTTSVTIDHDVTKLTVNGNVTHLIVNGDAIHLNVYGRVTHSNLFGGRRRRPVKRS